MVIVDANYLPTLIQREIRSGMAEIIKYGLTYDNHLYQKIKENPQLNIVDLIHRSIEIKNEVVLQDPKEQQLRKILNFGHTIGHAIESYFLESEHKENLTHGEAIAIGMVAECYLSAQLFSFPKEELEAVKKLVLTIYGKVAILEEDFEAILAYLKHDKKNVGGQINFVLLNQIEETKIDCKVSNKQVIESILFYNK